MQKDFYGELKELIQNETSNEVLKSELENYHNSDIADVLEDLTKEDRLRIYSIIGIEKTSDIFEFYDDVENYIEELDPALAADVVERMDSNDAMDVLNELEEDDKSEIIQLMESDSKKEVLKLDSYDESLIGSYMSDNFIVIEKGASIKKAMSTVIENAGSHDNIFTIYVEDEEKKFYGAVTLKDLIVARKDDLLENLIMTSYPSFYDDEQMSDCINKLKDYAETSIPVLNRNNQIIGVITSDSVVLATEDELTEDYAKLAGLSDTEEIDESVWASVKKRIPWLIALLFLGFIVSSVIGGFDAVIAAVPIAVLFQSMILDMSGNVGTQSLAVTIRTIAQEDDDDSKKKHRQAIFKELRVGICNGLIIAAIAFLFVFIYVWIKNGSILDGNPNSLHIAGIIAVSLFVAMTLSSLIGTVFPLFLNKIHIDPAVASGPFITTMNDIIAVVVYYGLIYLLFII